MVAYAAQRAGRHGWACLAVCAAGILKFYPFVLLPWFVWTGGRMRGRWYRLMGAMGFVIAVVVLTGSGLWRELFQYGIPMGIGEEIGRTFHFSLPALVTNLGYLYHDFHLSPAAKQWWWLAGTSAGLAVIAAAYVACLSTHRDPEAEFCRLCVAMLMGTVTVQGCYFVFLVFPLAVAAIRIAAKPTPGKVIYLILLIVAVNRVDPRRRRFFGGTCSCTFLSAICRSMDFSGWEFFLSGTPDPARVDSVPPGRTKLTSNTVTSRGTVSSARAITIENR